MAMAFIRYRSEKESEGIVLLNDNDQDNEDEEDEDEDEDEDDSADGSIDPDSMGEVSRSLTWLCIGWRSYCHRISRKRYCCQEKGIFDWENVGSLNISLGKL